MSGHRQPGGSGPKSAKLRHDPHQSRRRNQIQHGLSIPHVAKYVCHRGKRPTMFRVGQCRAGIGGVYGVRQRSVRM
jgi:hypothetical protein